MTGTQSMTVFDRRLVRRHRERAAPRWAQHDFLFREIADRLADRLHDVQRPFARVLDLGCHGGEMRRAALATGRAFELYVAADLAPAMAHLAGPPAVACDEEYLPFAEASFDLVLTNLSLHWVNDLPGALVQINRALAPDGFFLGAMLGGETLFELRRCLMEAELETTGGISPRISPMAEVRDAGALLQRTGFALPVVDADTLTVTYPHPLALIAELRGMGETNTALERRRVPLRRQVLATAVERYAALYADADGRIPVTFQVLYMAGWAPHESQQKPLPPGSARTRLADALGTREAGTGAPAAPRRH